MRFAWTAIIGSVALFGVPAAAQDKSSRSDACFAFSEGQYIPMTGFVVESDTAGPEEGQPPQRYMMLVLDRPICFTKSLEDVLRMIDVLGVDHSMLGHHVSLTARMEAGDSWTASASNAKLTEKSTGQAAPTCLAYEPKTVTISGTIRPEKAFGPPGYGATPKQDAVERYLSLSPDAPICLSQGDDDTDYAENDVKQMQLVFANGAPPTGIVGHVQVTGTLFHSDNGHHHTKVLLNVQKVR